VADSRTTTNEPLSYAFYSVNVVLLWKPIIGPLWMGSSVEKPRKVVGETLSYTAAQAVLDFGMSLKSGIELV
jgi:hypothetical protein